MHEPDLSASQKARMNENELMKALDESAWKELSTSLSFPMISSETIEQPSSTMFLCMDCTKEADKGSSSKDLITFSLSSQKWSSCVDVTALLCGLCTKCISLWYSGVWWSRNDILHSLSHLTDGLHSVTSPEEYLAVFVLSQFCHNEEDLDTLSGESPFAPPSPDDVIRLVVAQGQAAGFYSLKRKGTPFPQSLFVRYAIDVVDTIYIRQKFRRQGLATRCIDDVVNHFHPGSLIGFSEPLSDSLLKVLERYLVTRPALRDQLWGCSYTGEPGYRWSVHLHLRTDRSTAAAT